MAFAIFASSVMVLVALGPLVEKEATATSPIVDPVAPASNDLPRSDSAGIPAETTDSVGGPSPRPGSVTSGLAPQPPMRSSLPANAVPSHLEETAVSFRYTTVAGTYEFPKATPYIASYATPEGETLVTASTFVVIAPGIRPFGHPTVLTASDDRFETRYELGKGPVQVGAVTLTYDFRDDGPPKITAALAQSGSQSWSLTWVSFPIDRVAFGGATPVAFASATSLSRIETPDFRVSVGPDADPARSSRRLVLDWSDAGAGTASVGLFSLEGLAGPAILIEFPARMTIVDPTIVGTSTSSGATNYPIQRKTFEYGGRYWAFWYDGTAIVYASAQFAYANGQNTLTWSVKMTTPSATLPSGANYRGFDVAQRDGTVLIGYHPSGLTSFKILIGKLVGSLITWSGSYTAGSWPTAEGGASSVAIGSDGYYWAAAIGKDGSPTLYVARSTSPGATTFSSSLSETLPGSAAASSAVRIIALSNGRVIFLRATEGDSNIVWRRYWQGGWGPTNTWNLWLPTSGLRADRLTAVADPQDNVEVLYIGDPGSISPGLRWVTIYPDDGFTYRPRIDSELEPGALSRPTVALDMSGQLHAYWRYDDISFDPCPYYIHYSKQNPVDVWSAQTSAYGCFADPLYGLTAAALVSSRAFLIWTKGTVAPFSVEFGGVVTSMDFGSQTGQPWDRQGLSPYQSYFQQLSEFVSPGSGLLTVRQTDLVLPGRNLDLEIARVFVTPRAYQEYSGSPSPYLYEEYPAANLGKGWRLNFPWISTYYVNLWDGQMYVIQWDGDRFENHDGEHFVLTKTWEQACDCYIDYRLQSKNGLTYVFDFSTGRLAYIRHPSSEFYNRIAFTYNAAGKIDYIEDSVGRIVDFVYNADGTLFSVSSGPYAVTYSYQAAGSARLLSSVRDALSRETHLEYSDLRSFHMITAIQYPTGAKTAFTWSNPAVTLGPDLRAFFVTLQDVLNTQGQSIRSNQYSYTVVNGRVTYVNVVTYDAGVEKGCTVQFFDPSAGRSMTIRKAAPCAQPGTGTQLGKEVSWFDSAGAISQVDAYPGSSTTPAYSTNAAYDEWGNSVYSRDAIGHERFASYVNTRYQGGFFAPGRLTRTASGLLLFDDFEDRDLSDWTLDQTAGTVGLNYTAFESAPPSVKIAHTGGGSGVASAAHTFSGQTASFVAEVTVRAEETNREHFILLRSSTSMRVYVDLYWDGYIYWRDGSSWQTAPGMTYVAKQWYRIAFEIFPATNLYDIWINGKEVKTGAPLQGSGTIDQVVVQASYSGGGAATVYVDQVKVYTAGGLTIGGLQAGQMARLEDSAGRLVDWTQVGSGATTTTLVADPGVFPTATVKIFDAEGFLAHSSPSHEFWGGDYWTFTAPWKAFPGRGQSGFLRSAVNYVDDVLPSGARAADGEDGWNFYASDRNSFGFPVSGSYVHGSKNLVGTHQHYFYDASWMIAINSGMYHIQYISVPWNEYPAEIMLQFRDTSDSWEHRAYWGANLIAWGTDGTSSRRSMGKLPGSPGRWLMLIAKADDVGMNTKTLEGLAYTLYGGRAAWDYSAVGLWDTGWIQVSGLQPSWKAEVYDPKGTLVSYGTVPAGGTVAAIPMYDGTTSKVRAFPFEGYFLLRDSANNPVYRSPVMFFWGGDIYNYGGTNFYPNMNVDPDIHDRPACMLEYQTGRGASPAVDMWSCYRYTSQGLVDRSKVNDGTAWRETSYAYDGTYGLLTSVTDPKGNTVSSAYSPTYGRAYMTKASDSVGTIARNTYDPTSGWPLAEMNGRGYITRHGFDLLGRPTTESSFDLPAASEVLYLDMEWTTEEATPKMEDLSGKGNHGSIFGTTAAPGRVGMARDFDGSGDYLQAADSPTLDIAGSQITIAAWVYPKSSSTSNIILNKESTYEIALNAGVFQAAVETSASGSWAWGGTQAVPLNRWAHLAFVYESGSTWKFYVNGVLKESIAPAGGQTGNIAPSNYALRVGDRTAFVSPFVGLIDEARVLNIALSATDIAALSANSYRLLSSSEIAYDDAGNVVTWYEPTTKPRTLHFDMETLLNSKMEDLAGRGFHGVLTGTSATANGKVGGARDFDGIDDMVSVTASPGLTASAAFTAAVWINPDTLPTSAGDGIVGKLDFANSWRIWIRPDGKIEFDAKSDTVGNLVSTTAVTTGGGWYHVVGTFDGSTAKLYVNGVPETSASTSDWGNMANVNIGIGDTDSTYPFDGQIDEVHLFSRALSAAEITELYQGTEKGFYQKGYFDALGRSIRSLRRDMFGAFVSWRTSVYNFQDRVVSSTVARSSTTTFTTTYGYDFPGRPTTVTYPEYPNNPLTFTYDDVNRIRTVVSENGRKMEYVSDLGGRTTAVREYYSSTSYYTTSLAYDEAGNLLSVTSALNQVTRHEYDNLNRLTKTIYPDTTKYEQYTYDEVGNLKTRRDRAGQVTTYNYDNRYRLTSIDYPGTSSDVSYAYNLNDNPTSVTNPSATVSYVYDGMDRVRTENTTVGGTTYPVDYAYDPSGRVTRLTYPHNADNSRSWVEYTYDAVGRTDAVKDASTTFATFSYLADDLIKDVAFGNQVTQSILYNGRGWPTSIKATRQTTTYLDLGYTYDASGNVLTMGSDSFTYDLLDRLKTASGGFGSLTYTYDAVGNRLTEDKSPATLYTRRPSANGAVAWSPNGCTANWDCVDESSSDGDTGYVSTSTIGATDLYDLPDLPDIGSKGIEYVEVTAVARDTNAPPPPPPPPCALSPIPCGTSSDSARDSSLEGSESILAGTDDAIYLRVNGNRGTSRSLGYSYGAQTQRWTTNPATGQPWTAAEVNALQAGVEAADVLTSLRVTQVSVTVKVFDGAVYYYNNGPTGMNELTSVNRNGALTTFTYDGNGNLASKKGGGSFTCYEWSPENLLARVKSVSSSCADTGTQVQKYVYDGLGRRVRVEGSSASTWLVSIVSGMDTIYEKDNAGAVTTYVYANGMRIAKINPDNTVRYYLADHLGSTRKVLDASRNTVFSTDYEPFGKPYSPSGTEAYKYTSEKHDDPTGLVYLRARQYDPEIGRFVSADPVLGSLGDPQSQNRYVYVTNNPARFVDPTGREIFGAIAGAIIGAVIGGVVCAAQNDWQWSDSCWKAVAVGALAGAIGGLTFNPAASMGVWAAFGMTVAVGAATGAASSAVAYTANYALTPGAQWSWNDFGGEVAMGAAIGAVSAGAAAGLSRMAARSSSPLLRRLFGVADDSLAGSPVGKVTAKGVVVQNPGIRATSYSTHALKRMIQRGGMTTSQVDDIVARGVAIAQGDSYYFVSRAGAVAMTRNGHVITAYPSASFYEETWALIFELGL